MTAAVLVAMVAGAEALGWRLGGRTRLFAVMAWLVIALAAAGVTGAVGGWGAAGLGLGAGAWLVLRWRWGADAAIGSLVVIAGLLLLADPEPSRAAAILAGLGSAVLLTHTANDVCRDVIARARVLPGEDAPAERAEDAPRLRGGRFIGPLERWLIVGLALVGAQAVIVGLMAAKGIGRFPEISGDRGRGSTAEEFLVGSLVSWALAGAAALLIAVLMP
ncbi:hypothetical protein [Demequina lignilytica]|uniref:Uncharacterized protein n=1 Tax=Demequina lignilytica TaxID=3051663 RepID=A0AAW7LZT9_9MICO|nr:MULTISPECIES: hypothetical protein [unclassified Demequina]MDN4478529.1 hypothetical protein [Demequina sp. SYSU T00039-1]MDN4482313.1 hypothetical protein [Demequina sp. SYSU T0a273]MDN4486964.1 hypothetical protein [Demequina sp. SYSU T00039]MDN4489648.1 hypothetical protein [Demequina sp. SYSU T00068]